MLRTILPILAAAVLTLTALHAQNEPADPAAEKLWQEVVEAAKPPVPPADWSTPPTEEQQEAFKKLLAAKAGEAADKARDFYTKYPDHPKVREAQEREKLMLTRAVSLGDQSRLARLEASPALTEDEKFEAKVNELNRRAMARQPDGIEAVLGEFEKGARDLMKEYPERPELWHLLFLVAQNAPEEKAKPLFKEIAASDAPDEIKEQAQASLNKMDAVGQPLELKFTSIDGREIDLQKMKGKVVLVDFWATWCGPCIQELPNVLKAYENLHDQGFEILGISFDQKEEALKNFVKKEKMTWPQYFDGQGWGNKIGREFGITAIPTMWLVDKKGILRDLNARPGLEQKVKDLLAEK